MDFNLTLFYFSHVSVGDRHSFGLDGRLSSHAVPPLLQRQLPVREASSVADGRPRGPRPVPVGRGQAAGRHVHGGNHVSQLAVLIRVQLCCEDGVSAHERGHLLFSDGWRGCSLHHCSGRQTGDDAVNLTFNIQKRHFDRDSMKQDDITQLKQ